MSLNPRDAVVVDAVRSAMGRSKGGAFRYVRADVLSAGLVEHLLHKYSQIEPDSIDDLIWGCVNQTLEQGLNIARNIVLLAGLPVSVPGQTINRLCGSSMSAIHTAAQAIAANQGDCFLIGGVEHMGHVPMDHGIDIAPRLNQRVARGSLMMGLTAEMLAYQFNISRQAQDKFSLRSHLRAAEASETGLFDDELVALEVHDDKGAPILVNEDEVIRADASLDALSALRPVFDPVNGTVTAGSSSALSDGASAMLVMSAERAGQLGLTPIARIRAMSVVGVDPAVMGIGPVPAVRKLLKSARMQLSDIDLFELNEAFAAQSLAVLGNLDLLEQMDDKVNLKGGAIALGHPLGCSGARISTTLLHTMQQRKAQWGVATMCIGLGQGIATLFEAV